MTTPELHARVNNIFLSLFEVEEARLKPEANLFADLGLDSLDAIDLVISFQREFKIKPENKELQAIRTLDDVYQLVRRYHEALGASHLIAPK
jgi:acyl carrier protein